MKRVSPNGDGSEFVIGDLDLFGVGVFIDLGLDSQARSCRSAADQIDDDLPAEQGTPAPVGCNMTKHAVLDLVPLAGFRWEMAHQYGQAQFVG